MKAKGAALLVQIWTGSAWETIGESRSDSMSLTNESVDTTEKTGAPWRDLFACGQKTITLSSQGIMGDKTRLAVQKIKRSAFFAETLHARLKSDAFVDVSYFYGMKYIATSFQRTGEYNGAETFSFTLESASMPLNSDETNGGSWTAGEDGNGDWGTGYAKGFATNNGGSGDYYFRIDTQPTNQSVLQPDAATFTCIASSSVGPISYQWKKNGVNVGTNSTTYTTGATTWTGVDDVITCVVSNGVASLTSSQATLNVRKISITQATPNFPTPWSCGGGIQDSGEVFAIGGHSASSPMYKGVPGDSWTNSGVNQPGINNNGSISCGVYDSSYMYLMMQTGSVALPYLKRFSKSNKTWDTLTTLDSYYIGSGFNRYAVCIDGPDFIVFWQHLYSGDTMNKSQLLKYSGGSWTLLNDYGAITTPSLFLPNANGSGFFIRIGGYYYLGANTRRNDPSANVRIYKIDVSTYAVSEAGFSCGMGAQGVLVGNKILYAHAGRYRLFDGSSSTDIGAVGAIGQDASNGVFVLGNSVAYNIRGNSPVDVISL